jgi:hypothetical protein
LGIGYGIMVLRLLYYRETALALFAYKEELAPEASSVGSKVPNATFTSYDPG